MKAIELAGLSIAEADKAIAKIVAEHPIPDGYEIDYFAGDDESPNGYWGWVCSDHENWGEETLEAAIASAQADFVLACGRLRAR